MGRLKYPVRERAWSYGHGKDELLSWFIAAGRLGSKGVLEHQTMLWRNYIVIIEMVTTSSKAIRCIMYHLSISKFNTLLGKF
jgi:hypothetical protein